MATRSSKHDDERREHKRDDTTAHPTQRKRRGTGPGAAGPADAPEPFEPAPRRAPQAERGPGSAGADLGMTADGGRGEDTTEARPDRTPNERKR